MGDLVGVVAMAAMPVAALATATCMAVLVVVRQEWIKAVVVVVVIVVVADIERSVPSSTPRVSRAGAPWRAWATIWAN